MYPTGYPTGAVPGPRTSTAGPKGLTFTGVALLMLAVAAGVGAVVMFLGVLNLGVVTEAGPGGQTLTITQPSGSTKSTINDFSLEYRWEFTTSEAGTYRIDVPAGNIATLMLTNASVVNDLIGKILWSVLLTIAAIGLGMIGLGLTIGGGIWWHTRAKRARLSTTPVGVAPPPAPYV